MPVGQGRETGRNWGCGGGYPPPGEREGGYSGRGVTLRVRLQFSLRCGLLTSWRALGVLMMMEGGRVPDVACGRGKKARE